MFIELFWNMIHSTSQGYLGVSLIFGYMGLIVLVALYRIFQNAAHH